MRKFRGARTGAPTIAHDQIDWDLFTGPPDRIAVTCEVCRHRDWLTFEELDALMRKFPQGMSCADHG